MAAPPIHRAQEVRHRRGLALAIIVTCQLMLILDATVMNVALPRIQGDLHFSAAGLAWVMSSYTLTYGGLLLLGGRAGDILGRRRMFVAGVALFTRGFGALATRFGFLPMAGGIFAMTRLIPHLLPRFGPKPLVVSGSLLVIGGLAWLTQLTPASGYAAGVLGPMLLMGFGGGMSFVPLTPVIMAAVAPQDAGAASGVLQTMQQTGASLGLAVLVTVFGTVVRHAAPGAPAHETLVSGMTAAFAVATAFAACIVVVALTFRRTRKRQPA